MDPCQIEHNISLEELLKKWNVPTASIMYRNSLLVGFDNRGKYINGDYALELYMKSNGDFHYDPSLMSVYRMHGDSVSAGMNRNKAKMYDDIIRLLSDLKLYYSKTDEVLFDDAIKRYEAYKSDYLISSHPVKKWFYRKTYTRYIKSLMRQCAMVVLK